ncbi:hypothetical protein N431DRAFT_561933 [Stipitochalara longipes BDJ]|nr:hypothetical protein N431DRAFT_561933 [Stipitochalara longipes BDJ]
MVLACLVMDTNSQENISKCERSAILEACSCGDIAVLQKLLEGTEPQHHSGPIAVCKLLATAVASKQTSTVKFLLERYPTYSIYEEFGIIKSILDNGDADTLQVLCAHNPRLASSSMDYGMRCFITDACAQPPERIVPVLHVLLDNNADVNDGWGPGGGALYAALLGSQPQIIIERIVQNGGEISYKTISVALQKERLDVLQSLLRKGRFQNRKELEKLVQCAKETGNEEAITTVQDFAMEWIAKRDRRERKHAKAASTRWWQIWRFWG